MLKVISCIERHKKEDNKIYYQLNIIETETGLVAANVYSSTPFKTNDILTGELGLVYSQKNNGYTVGVKQLTLKV